LSGDKDEEEDKEEDKDGDEDKEDETDFVMPGPIAVIHESTELAGWHFDESVFVDSFGSFNSYTVVMTNESTEETVLDATFTYHQSGIIVDIHGSEERQESLHLSCLIAADYGDHNEWDHSKPMEDGEHMHTELPFDGSGRRLETAEIEALIT